LIQQPAIFAVTTTDKADGIDVQRKGKCAAFVRCLGVEHVCAAEGQLQLLTAGRVLVQQIAEIGGGPMGRSD
jgi:hypothetical protein